jgi:hypothetical protein
MRVIVSALPIVTVVIWNVAFSQIFLHEGFYDLKEDLFLIWCLVSGGVAGILGAKIFSEW